MSRVPYVPTPTSVAIKILEEAGLKSGEVLVDAGAGECGVVIEAAKRFGALGIGVERDPMLVKRCLERVFAEGLVGKVYVVWGDVFDFDYSIADVVYLYLGTDMNRELAPVIFRSVRRGVRVVSHDFEIPGYRPVKQGVIQGPLREHRFYIYVKS